jgi:acetyltransferase-like isoleucine patch superfamily enzyme
MTSLPLIREPCVFYPDVTVGDNFQTGHFVLIRENTKIGDNVLVGSGTIIEGNCKIGNNVRIQSGVFIPKGVEIGNNVFIGPRVVFTNDKYPPGPIIKTIVEDDVVIGAAALILPGLTLGRGCFVAAGALVTRNVPWDKMAIGNPAKISPMPEMMKRD